MPLSNPPQVAVVAFELNTPADGSGVIVFDAWYDLADADIAASKTAALAAIGLTWAGTGEFTTTRKGIWSLSWKWGVNAAPGGACSVQLDSGTFDTPFGEVIIPNPNTIGYVSGHTIVAHPAGGQFWWRQTCTAGTDVPLDYMAGTIVRLV